MCIRRGEQISYKLILASQITR